MTLYLTRPNLIVSPRSRAYPLFGSKLCASSFAICLMISHSFSPGFAFSSSESSIMYLWNIQKLFSFKRQVAVDFLKFSAWRSYKHCWFNLISSKLSNFSLMTLSFSLLSKTILWIVKLLIDLKITYSFHFEYQYDQWSSFYPPRNQRDHGNLYTKLMLIFSNYSKKDYKYRLYWTYFSYLVTWLPYSL